MTPRLELAGISKSFGAIRAVQDVSFAVAPGRVHALLGENGAGKSTLVKIVTGIEAADAGEIRLDGRPVRFRSPMAARTSGVVAVYQDPKLFPHLDVAENIFMGIQPTDRLGLVDRRRMYTRARELLAGLEAGLEATAPVAGLSIAEAQFVEFARALAEGGDRLLILDEPTASLTPPEVERLFRVVRRIRDRGTSVIIISHRLEELQGLVDTVTVLRDGLHVATRPADTLSEAEVIRLMVGRDLERTRGTGVDATMLGAERLRVERLSLPGVFETISFSLRAGEVVALAGLVGAGRTELAQSLFGVTPPASGRVLIDGEAVAPRHPRQMLAAGLAYLPEDRDGDGLVTARSIVENIVLPITARLGRAGFLRPGRERATARRYADDLQIRCASIDQAVAALSGGNRQKVVLGKWLAMGPKVLILDEPTHGIDVGTKAQVHAIVRGLARDGLAILLISSDLPEVLAMGDRVLVMAGGRLAAELARGEATEERVMGAAARRPRLAARGMSLEQASVMPVPSRRPALGRREALLQNRVLGIAGFLLLLVLLFGLAADNFASLGNLNTIALNASILVVVACAEAIVVITRNYDLSVGSTVALAAFVGLDLIRLLPDLGPPLVIVPVLIGGLCGAMNGWLVAYGGLPSVIATLGTLSIFRGVAFLYAGGSQLNAADLPAWVPATASSQVMGISTLVIVAAAVVALTWVLLQRLRLGREIYAVGSNPDAAAYFGLDARWIVFRAYVLCGLLTGLAAFLLAARASWIVPYLAQGLELTALAAVVLGGVSVLGGSGSVVGAALGAVALATIDNGLILLGTSEFARQLTQGLLIILAVILDAVLQRRVAGLLRAMRKRRAA